MKGARTEFLNELAIKIGINASIVLEKLHKELLYSPLQQDGYTWFIHSYEKWKNQFPYWSRNTIIRTFLKLEKEGFIVSMHEFNCTKYNQGKWYRIDYEKLLPLLGPEGREYFAFPQSNCHAPQPQNGTGDNPNWENSHTQNGTGDNPNWENSHTQNGTGDNPNWENSHTQNDTGANSNWENSHTQNGTGANSNWEYFNTQNDTGGYPKRDESHTQNGTAAYPNCSKITGFNADESSFLQNEDSQQPKFGTQNNILINKIIHYLNKKANKNYNPQSFINLITQRLNEGYTFEDFQYVIDLKVSQWLHDEKMNPYLRPYTLFKHPNFEKYLQEKTKQDPNNHYQPVELDFTAGEDAPRLKWL